MVDCRRCCRQRVCNGNVGYAAMPVKPLNGNGASVQVDPSVAGTYRVCDPGNRFNGITIAQMSTGVEIWLKLGNNPEIGPISGAYTVTFGHPMFDPDVTEGVDIVIRNAVPGGSLSGWISYTTTSGGVVTGWQ